MAGDCVGLSASCACPGSKTTGIADKGVKIKTRINNKAYALFKIAVRFSPRLIKIYIAEKQIGRMENLNDCDTKYTICVR
jgi:hypothetical protein